MDEVLEHHLYLSDSVRLDAYRSALASLITPGDVVLDLGAGTGVLGLMAKQAGAARVYSVDRGSIVGLGRQIARANGVEGAVFVRGESTRIKLPEPVDLVVCDQMSAFGFEARLLQSFRDAATRHLRPGGHLVPSRLDLQIAPVRAPDLRSILDFWQTRPAGLHFGPAHQWAVNHRFNWAVDPDQILGSVCELASLDTASHGDRAFTMTGASEIHTAGVVDGIAGWFVAQLASSVSLSNSPLWSDRINRQVAVLPLERSMSVGPGDEIVVDVRANPASSAISWRVMLRSHRDESSHLIMRHSTLLGDLISREDLDLSRAQASPNLGPRAKARLSVLSWADQGRCVAAIEESCAEAYPDQFSSPAAVRLFVGEVLRDAER